MITRAQAIKAGRIHQVYPDDDPDANLFEGSKAACIRYLKAKGLWGQYKIGNIRVGRLIWEPEQKQAT